MPRADPMSFWMVGLAVAVGVLALLSIGAGIARHLRRLRPPYPTPDGWGTDPDDRKWEEEAVELSHTALDDVRESAKAWAGSIGALLGVGGTVAFVKGEDAFSKLSTSEGNVAFWLTVAAALLAVLAIALATFAAQGTPHRYASLDGWTLNKVSREREQRAMELLLWSRTFAIVAAIAVLGGFGIAWKAGIASDDPATVSAIAATDDGTVRCGELQASPDGTLTLKVGDVTQPLQKDSDVDTIDSCPAD